jgi:hypothetical protein
VHWFQYLVWNWSAALKPVSEAVQHVDICTCRPVPDNLETCWDKSADHLPLYRQADIYAREGVELDRSTLADWVGAASHLLTPLVDQVRRHVLTATKPHADDTPVPVLAPGMGKTKTARLWTYVRDDRPAGDDAPPSVWFTYSEAACTCTPPQNKDLKGSIRGVREGRK